MITTGLHDLPLLASLSAFDPAPCGVDYFVGNPDVDSGGGDTFDCYSDGADAATLPEAGTGFSGGWKVKKDHYVMMGDDFQSYAAENPITSTLSGGTGFSGAWRRG